jgi:hypothetical protein
MDCGHYLGELNHLDLLLALFKRSEEKRGVRVWRTLGHILEERRVHKGLSMSS